MRSSRAASSTPRDVGAGKVELVIVAVEAAVADQHQHQRVVGLGVARDLRQRVLDVALVACGPYSVVTLASELAAVQQLVDILGLGCEALLVIGLAAESGDGDVEGGRRCREPDARASARPKATLHTTPHLRRSSHSVQHSSNARKNTIGISHRSLVSRTRDAGVRIGNIFAQPAHFIRAIVSAAGLRGKLFEQIAILLQMEILGHAVFAAERDHVASQFLLAARGGDFGHVRPGFGRHPSRPCKRPAPADPDAGPPFAALPSGPTMRACTWRIAGGQIGRVANLGAQMHMAIVVQHRLRRSMPPRASACRSPASAASAARTSRGSCPPPAAASASANRRRSRRPRCGRGRNFRVISSGSLCPRKPSFRPAPARPAWAVPLPGNSSGRAASSSARRSRRDFLRCA